MGAFVIVIDVHFKMHIQMHSCPCEIKYQFAICTGNDTSGFATKLLNTQRECALFTQGTR